MIWMQWKCIGFACIKDKNKLKTISWNFVHESLESLESIQNFSVFTQLKLWLRIFIWQKFKNLIVSTIFFVVLFINQV